MSDSDQGAVVASPGPPPSQKEPSSLPPLEHGSSSMSLQRSGLVMAQLQSSSFDNLVSMDMGNLSATLRAFFDALRYQADYTMKLDKTLNDQGAQLAKTKAKESLVENSFTSVEGALKGLETRVSRMESDSTSKTESMMRFQTAAAELEERLVVAVGHVDSFQALTNNLKTDMEMKFALTQQFETEITRSQALIMTQANQIVSLSAAVDSLRADNHQMFRALQLANANMEALAIQLAQLSHNQQHQAKVLSLHTGLQSTSSESPLGLAAGASASSAPSSTGPQAPSSISSSSSSTSSSSSSSSSGRPSSGGRSSVRGPTNRSEGNRLPQYPSSGSLLPPPSLAVSLSTEFSPSQAPPLVVLEGPLPSHEDEELRSGEDGGQITASESQDDRKGRASLTTRDSGLPNGAIPKAHASAGPSQVSSMSGSNTGGTSSGLMTQEEATAFLSRNMAALRTDLGRTPANSYDVPILKDRVSHCEGKVAHLQKTVQDLSERLSSVSAGARTSASTDANPPQSFPGIPQALSPAALRPPSSSSSSALALSLLDEDRLMRTVASMGAQVEALGGKWQAALAPVTERIDQLAKRMVQTERTCARLKSDLTRVDALQADVSKIDLLDGRIALAKADIERLLALGDNSASNVAVLQKTSGFLLHELASVKTLIFSRNESETATGGGPSGRPPSRPATGSLEEELARMKAKVENLESSGARGAVGRPTGQVSLNSSPSASWEAAAGSAAGSSEETAKASSEFAVESARILSDLKRMMTVSGGKGDGVDGEKMAKLEGRLDDKASKKFVESIYTDLVEKFIKLASVTSRNVDTLQRVVNKKATVKDVEECEVRLRRLLTGMTSDSTAAGRLQFRCMVCDKLAPTVGSSIGVDSATGALASTTTTTTTTTTKTLLQEVTLLGKDHIHYRGAVEVTDLGAWQGGGGPVPPLTDLSVYPAKRMRSGGSGGGDGGPHRTVLPSTTTATTATTSGGSLPMPPPVPPIAKSSPRRGLGMPSIGPFV